MGRHKLLGEPQLRKFFSGYMGKESSLPSFRLVTKTSCIAAVRNMHLRICVIRNLAKSSQTSGLATGPCSSPASPSLGKWLVGLYPKALGACKEEALTTEPSGPWEKELARYSPGAEVSAHSTLGKGQG